MKIPGRDSRMMQAEIIRITNYGPPQQTKGNYSLPVGKKTNRMLSDKPNEWEKLNKNVDIYK